MSEWDDDEFGVEYYKFNNKYVDKVLESLYDYCRVAYLEIDWDSIRTEQNDWNKKRKRVNVQEIILADFTPEDKDKIIENNNLVLDMGARLFNEIKRFAKDKPTYLKIVQVYNPRDKFDTFYHASVYKRKLTKKPQAKATKK